MDTPFLDVTDISLALTHWSLVGTNRQVQYEVPKLKSEAGDRQTSS